MISVYHIHMVCIDLRANLLGQTSIICDFSDSDEYFRNMAGELERFLDENHVDRSHLLGVGVACPVSWTRNGTLWCWPGSWRPAGSSPPAG